MKFAIRVLFVFLTLSPALLCAQNIVFVIADDCTFRDIGCYGGQAHTPNIDKLASEGIRFTRCFQAAPMCSPTRHNLYTGLYPVKSGAYPNHAKANDGVKSIVHHLRPLGYRVAISGKSHIDPQEVFPFEKLKADKNNPNMKLIDGFFAESAESEKPFCLFACSNEPHGPWDKGDASKYPAEKVQLPSNIVNTPLVRENFSRYLAEVTYFDGQVGEILTMLDKHGLSDNTMVMVVSEQGSGFPFAKWTCYDSGLQSAMVEYVDVAPTFIDAAGGDIVDGLEGRSFLPVLKGETDTHKSHVYGIMTTRGILNGSDAYAVRSVRGDKFKLIMNLNHESKFSNVLQQSALFQSMVDKAAGGDENAKRLVHDYQYRPRLELFNIEADPLEMNNLAEDTKYAPELKRLQKKLEAWMAEQGDEGGPTELAAFEHQNDYQRKKREKEKSAK